MILSFAHVLVIKPQTQFDPNSLPRRSPIPPQVVAFGGFSCTAESSTVAVAVAVAACCVLLLQHLPTRPPSP